MSDLVQQPDGSFVRTETVVVSGELLTQEKADADARVTERQTTLAEVQASYDAAVAAQTLAGARLDQFNAAQPPAAPAADAAPAAPATEVAPSFVGEAPAPEVPRM